MSSIVVRQIPASATYPLRNQVLRPGLGIETCQWAGDETAVHFGAHDGDQVIGVASIYRINSPSTPTGGGGWQLRGMATAGSARGRGVGKLVLQACLAHARKEGGHRLWCNARTSAADFYAGQGFQKDGPEFDIAGVGPHFRMSIALMAAYRLIASKGAGSAITEMMLEWRQIPYSVHELAYEQVLASDPAIASLNPLSEVPTLVLPDGFVMTESAAMALHLDDVTAGGPRLLPPAGDPSRPRALKWLAFLVAAVYPTFTYGDDPSQWIRTEAARDELKQSTDEHRKALWRLIETEVSASPWCLGAEPSALDFYVCAMTRWRPGHAWFEKECPKLTGIAQGLATHPGLRASFDRNFGT